MILFSWTIVARKGYFWSKTEKLHNCVRPFLLLTLHKKSPYLELFCSVFFPHFPAFGLNTEYLSVFSPNAGKCGKNADQNYSEYGHFLCSVTILNFSARSLTRSVEQRITLSKLSLKCIFKQQNRSNTLNK